MKRFIKLLPFLIMLQSCAFPLSWMPDSNAYEDRNGVGYMVDKLKDDVYSIVYKAPSFTTGASYENYWIMWHRKAAELCGAEKYSLKDKKENLYRNGGSGWIVRVDAIVTCT